VYVCALTTLKCSNEHTVKANAESSNEPGAAACVCIASGKSAPFMAQTFLFLRVLLFIVMHEREYHPEAATASILAAAVDSLAFVSRAAAAVVLIRMAKYVRKYRKRRD
jgi:hypothetical protein